MRPIEDALARWDKTFAKTTSISDLRASVIDGADSSPAISGLRSVCWKAFLLFENLDRSTWIKLLVDSRNVYAALKDHFLRDISHPEDITADPLGDDLKSPWNQMRRDEETRAEIFQDVERCMPENLHFREPETQSMLLDILFVYCKLNPDLGYRQGMHEILAPILWVISSDAMEPDNGPNPGQSSHIELDRKAAGPANFQRSDKTLKREEVELVFSCLDHQHIEHDAFNLFRIVMHTVKSYYETAPVSLSVHENSSSFISQRSQRIHEDYLVKADPELARHLTAIEIIPQIFLIRWIRLLFGREFALEEVLSLWDALFAKDPTLELVDLVCVAMLLRIRWQLIEADYTSALALLLRYPRPEEPHGPASFVEDAMRLRSNLMYVTGSQIIVKYSKRQPIPAHEPNSRPGMKARNRMRTASQSIMKRSMSPNLSPSKFIQEQGGIEAIIKGAAKGAYTRGEQWGVNRALRGAVQNLQAATASPNKAAEGSRWSLDAGKELGPEIATLTSRFETLHNRDKLLANLLGKAMDDLWTLQHHPNRREAEGESEDKLSLAIAKLQFVQVYLENPSMPLSAEEGKPASSSQLSQNDMIAEVAHEDKKSPVTERASEILIAPESPTHKPSRRPATSKSNQSPPRDQVPKSITSKPTAPSSLPSSTPAPSTKPHAQRPSITQSSFSWILGDDESNISPTKDPHGNAINEGAKLPFTASSSPPPSNVQRRGARERAAYLFGDVPTDNSGDGNGRDGSTGSSNKERRRRFKDKDGDEEEGIRLGIMHGVDRRRRPLSQGNDDAGLSQ